MIITVDQWMRISKDWLPDNNPFNGQVQSYFYNASIDESYTFNYTVELQFNTPEDEIIFRLKYSEALNGTV